MGQNSVGGVGVGGSGPDGGAVKTSTTMRGQSHERGQLLRVSRTPNPRAGSGAVRSSNPGWTLVFTQWKRIPIYEMEEGLNIKGFLFQTIS